LRTEGRIHTKEQLDNLALSGEILTQTLGSLHYINRFFGNHKYLGKAVLQVAKKKKDISNLRIVDLGCGGGDCIRSIARKLSKHAINASFIGIDGNPKSIAYAFKESREFVNISYVHADILAPNFEIPDCDILISSHFIYHFKDGELIHFLHRLKAKNVRHIIFSELRRSTMARWLFTLAANVLPLTQMAKKDGLLALRRTFTSKELIAILQKSKVLHFKVVRKPFFRTLALIRL